MKKFQQQLLEFVERSVQVRENAPQLFQPSSYWSEYVKFIRYVFTLPEEELKYIRRHTYHLTSDNYQRYFAASEEYAQLLKRGYDYFTSNPSITPVEEGEYGIGVIANPGGIKITHDLLRYLGIVNDIMQFPDILLKNDAKVAEIGGGYGGLARSIMKQNENISYVICDLEEVMFFSGIYLANNLGESRVVLVNDSSQLSEMKPGHVYFVPQARRELLQNCHFDLMINQQSFQEMTRDQVFGYCEMINELSDWFYSCNLNSRDNLADKHHLISNLDAELSAKLGKPFHTYDLPDVENQFGDNILPRNLYKLKK